LFFFFQAEDGIRDLIVTGVQTCALPISAPYLHSVGNGALAAHFHTVGRGVGKEMRDKAGLPPIAIMGGEGPAEGGSNLSDEALRSEERRVGKEWRTRRAAEASEKKNRRT